MPPENTTAAAPASVTTETASSATPGTTETSGAPKPAAAPAKAELFEVKVDGKVIKMTREELIQQASLGHASDKRFKEGAQLRKQAEAALGRVKDPEQMIAALQDPALGYSRDQIREVFENWYAKEFIETENLSPAEKRARDAEARVKKYEEDEKGREAQKLKEAQDAQTSQVREEIQKQIIEALDTSDLPRTNFTIRRLAYWMERNRQNRFDAPTSVLVGQVQKEFNSSLRDHVAASDGERLIKLLGDDIITKVRKYDLEQLRKLRQGGSAPTTQESAPNTPKPERAPTSAEVNQRIRQLQKTGRY